MKSDTPLHRPRCARAAAHVKLARFRPLPAVLATALARVANAVLDHPDAIGLTYSCRRLMSEAAREQPLSQGAMLTVLRIAVDFVVEGEPDADESVMREAA